MEFKNHCRFLLLDFGHPMTIKTIENVIKSLENVLALGAVFPRSLTEISFGISVLNTDLTIFQSRTNIRKNYSSIIKSLHALLNSMNTSSRITVQEYKYLLSKSIEAVLCEFEKSKCDSQCVIQLAMITKKTATVLADILMDVTNKLQKLTPNVHSIQKYKIVQILGEGQEKPETVLNTNSLIECTSYTDNTHKLNCFFKDWLLNSQRQVRIVLSEDPDFGVECDIEDCMINPVSLPDGEIDLFGDICSRDLNGTSKSRYPMKVIRKLPKDGLCPTLVYGIPRRVQATTSQSLSWTELQNNSKIFRELCRELNQTGLGLLAKTEKSSLTAFHFLSSDGEMLLLTDISPDELYLPRLDKSSRADFCEDPKAASVVKDCFKKIECLNEYTRTDFSSGIYEYLRHHMGHVDEVKRKNPVEEFEPNADVIPKSNAKENFKVFPSKRCYMGEISTNNGGDVRKKKQKKPKIDFENVHPALLTPNIVEKYRKIHSNAFKLPELSLNCNKNVK